MDENPGTSAQRAAQELGHKCETVCTMLKKNGIFHIKFQSEKIMLHGTIIAPGFSRNLASMLKQ